MTFSPISPAVIDAIRQLDSRVMRTLSEQLRDTVRAWVEQGLREGKGPREIARQLRQVIGLAPHQVEWVEKYKIDLQAQGMPGPRAEKALDTYRRRLIAQNAETNARTAALDAQKLGQHLSWQQRVEAGEVDGAKLTKRWSGTLDDRERDSHLIMEGETVPWDQPYSNGQMQPGDGEFNCRCVSAYTTAATPKTGAGAKGIEPAQLRIGSLLRRSVLA
jgi:uncharacterized protein with gpF-like domain